MTHLIPQVLNRYAITDQQNWTQISGKFVAGGGEKYLIIGVFNEFLSSPQAKPGHSFSGSAYYYIDDVSVSVEDICTHPCPPQASYMPITTVPDLTVPNLILHCTPNHTPISITFYGGLSYEFVILSNTQQVMYSFSEFFPLGSEGEFFVNWNGEENNGTALPQGVYNAILKIFNCQGSQQFNFAVNTTGSGVNPIHLPPLINIPYPGFSSCCGSSATFDNFTFPIGNTSIEKGSYISTVNYIGPVVVPLGADVIFRAGTVITLYPGFETTIGGEFEGFIETCGWHAKLRSPQILRYEFPSLTKNELIISQDNYYLFLEFESDQVENIKINIYDLFGRLIFSEAKNNINKEYMISINKYLFSQGVYICSLSIDENIINRKVFIYR